VKRVRWLIGALLVLVTLCSIVSPALAWKPLTDAKKSMDRYEKAKLALNLLMSNRKNAEKIFENLPPDVQQDVIELLKVKTIVAKIEKPKRLSTLSTNSNSAVIVFEGKNVTGMTLFKYTQRIDWCYDGSKITSKFRTRYGTVYMPFWKFNDHIGNQEQGGEGHRSYRAWTQGEFSLCLGGNIGCIQHVYPWIDMTVYGNGDWHGEKGY